MFYHIKNNLHNPTAKKLSIRQAIWQTMAFYDLFSFPLTNLEIIDNLYMHADEPVDVLAALAELRHDRQIDFADGFYFLPGRHKLVDTRRERYLATFKKWHLINREKYLFRLCPFIKMIGVANTMAYSNAKASGDIDLLIVAADRRLFTARLLITFWLAIFGRWRHGKQIQDRYCLSFFVTDRHLNLQSLRLSDSEDIYLTYWAKWLKPWYVVDRRVAADYFRANQWIKKYLPNCIFTDSSYHADQPYLTTKIVEWILAGTIGDWLEKILRYVMTDKIRRRHPHDDVDGIIVNDRMLKFHPSGKRREYQNELQARLRELTKIK